MPRVVRIEVQNNETRPSPMKNVTLLVAVLAGKIAENTPLVLGSRNIIHTPRREKVIHEEPSDFVKKPLPDVSISNRIAQILHFAYGQNKDGRREKRGSARRSPHINFTLKPVETIVVLCVKYL
jgi:hypothetical protein